MLKENDRISGGNIFEGIVSVRTLIANSLAFAAGNSGNDRKIKRVFWACRGMHRPHDSRDIRGHDKTERVLCHA